jgi:hypothetical protein
MKSARLGRPVPIRRHLLFVLLLGSLGMPSGRAQAPARPSIQQAYDRETIYLLSPNRYVRNNTVYSGATALQQEFRLSPGGRELYIRSRRNRTVALVVSLVGSAGTIYSLATGNRDHYKTFFVVSLGTGLVSSLLNAKASTQLNQAVWLRNRDALILSGNP